jgi:hypothetical protein
MIYVQFINVSRLSTNHTIIMSDVCTFCTTGEAGSFWERLFPKQYPASCFKLDFSHYCAVFLANSDAGRGRYRLLKLRR